MPSSPVLPGDHVAAIQVKRNPAATVDVNAGAPLPLMSLP